MHTTAKLREKYIRGKREENRLPSGKREKFGVSGYSGGIDPWRDPRRPCLQIK